MKINQDFTRQSVNLIAILAAFLTNVLANIAPINGLSIGAISNTFFQDVLIIPANYAFAIWGVIYLGLISLAIYQSLPSQQKQPECQKLGYFLAISSLAQIVWVIFFQLRWFTASVILMCMILLPLIYLYQRLQVGVKPVAQKQKWLIHYPVSLYLGWISVATIVNVAIAAYNLRWDGGIISPQAWTIIMLLIATALATMINYRRLDPIYPGVIVWALVAVSIRQLDNLMIGATAAILAIILGLIWLLRRIYPFSA